MPTKPIISIDVDDAAFQRFLGLFKDYSAKVEEMPASWKRLGDAMEEAGAGLAERALSAKQALALAGAQAALVAEAITQATKAQDGLGKATGTANKGMTELAKTAKGIGRTIFDMGATIVKLGAVGLGLGAFAGGFGFEALASAVLARSREAGGYGVTPGELASFRVNAQQYLSTNALSAAANVQNDVTKAGYLAALGINYTRARTQSATDLAFDELKAARAAYINAQKRGLPAMQMPAVSSYLALGGSIEDVRNAAANPLSDIEAAQRATRTDANALGFDRQTAASWIMLKRTLDKAGVTIETDLIRALAPLAPEIASLSKEVVGFVASFLKSKDFGIIVGDVRDGFKALNHFLVTTNWKEVGDDIHQLGSEVVAALRFFHLIPDDANKAKKDENRHGILGDTRFGKVMWRANDAVNGALNWLGNKLVGEPYHQAVLADLERVWMKAGGSPAAAANMAAIADAESGGNAKATNRNTDGSIDYGLWQINSVHAADLARAGLKNWRTDPLENAKAAFIVSGAGKNNMTPWATWNEYAAGKNTRASQVIASDLTALGKEDTRMSSLYKRYGSWAKVIAAISEGTSALDADIKAHGNDWIKYLPKGTREQVQTVAASESKYDMTRVLKLLRDRRPVKAPHISITNSTSARIAVSANAGAYA